MATRLPLRVVVIDDNSAFRGLLVELLGNVNDVVIVGEGESGEHAGPLVRRHRPDVAILDLMMPVTGWAALASVRRQRPSTRIVVLTAMDEEHRHEAARRGADAVVPKFGRHEFLAETLRALARITGRDELSVPAELSS